MPATAEVPISTNQGRLARFSHTPCRHLRFWGMTKLSHATPFCARVARFITPAQE